MARRLGRQKQPRTDTPAPCPRSSQQRRGKQRQWYMVQSILREVVTSNHSSTSRARRDKRSKRYKAELSSACKITDCTSNEGCV